MKKIGVLCSGNDMLALFKFLSKYDNEYIIFYDQLFGLWGDKPFELVLERVEKWISTLLTKGVEKIIVPPVVELSLQDEKYWDKILPLFQNYLMDYCFKYSLLGKIWLFGDWADVGVVQKLIQWVAKKYVLSVNQKKIRKFKFPFNYWVKEVSMWKYFLMNFSWSNIFVNKMVKNDLSYFKDSDVDTLVPLNYGYLHFEKVIARFFNFKRTRFHGIKKLEDVFVKIVEDDNQVVAEKKYSVQVLYTGQVEFLKREKRLLWLLQRWKSVVVDYLDIEF